MAEDSIWYLKVSSKNFPRKLNEALGDIEGDCTIADESIVNGCGDIIPKAERDNREILYSTPVCKMQGSQNYPEKKEIGLQEINFHGHKLAIKSRQSMGN